MNCEKHVSQEPESKSFASGANLPSDAPEKLSEDKLVTVQSALSKPETPADGEATKEVAEPECKLEPQSKSVTLTDSLSVTTGTNSVSMICPLIVFTFCVSLY